MSSDDAANADTRALRDKNRRLMGKVEDLTFRVQDQKELEAVHKLMIKNSKKKISNLKKMVKRQSEEMAKLTRTSAKFLDRNQTLERKLRAIRVQNRTRKKTVP